MKLAHLLAVTVALAAVSPPTVALADPSSPPGQNGSNAQLLAYCQSLLASGDFSDSLNFGRCMSFNSTSDEGFLTAFCQYLRGEGLLADYGFASFSDCVKNLHP